MAKFSRLEHAVIVQELARRTNLDPKIVRRVLREQSEIIRETISKGIEYPLSYVGMFTFTDIAPREAGKYWNGFTKQYEDYEPRQGYYRLKFRPQKEVAFAIRRGTRYGEGISLEESQEMVKRRKEKHNE